MMKESGPAGIQWVIIQHVLLEKESYIIHSIQWNDALEQGLVTEGLLPVDGDEKHSVTALIHCVLDHLHQSADASKFVKFCQCLAQHGNTAVSEHLWNSFRMNNTRAPATTPGPVAAAVATPVSKENTTVLRGKLQKVQGEASQLRTRLADLEEDQYKMSVFVNRAIDFEDEVTVKLGSLEDSKDLLRSQLSKREQGLDLWKKKEQDYVAEVEAMQQRMDDMSRLIRAKDSELDRLQGRTAKQQEQIQLLQAQIAADTTNKRPKHHNEPVGKPVKKSKPPPLKLPTIVKFQNGGGGNNHGAMDNSWDSTPRRRYGSENSVIIPASDRSSVAGAKPRPREPLLLSPIHGTPAAFEDSKAVVGVEAGGGKRPSQVLRQSLVRNHREYICNACEKWLGEKGGVVDMPNLQLSIPPQALSTQVSVTVNEIQQQAYVRELIDSVGLSEHVEPSMFVELQPHGLHFEKEVYLELKAQHMLSPKRLLVFHKDKDFYRKTKWTDISSECSPRSHKQNIVLTLGQFCSLQVFKLLTPPAPGSGAQSKALKNLATIVTNMLNEDTLRCQFHVFFSDFEQTFEVLCLPHKSVNVTNEAFTKDVLNAFFKRGLDYLGHGKSTVSVCHGEVLQFYLDAATKSPVFQGTADISIIETDGQVFSFSLYQSPPPPSSSSRSHSEPRLTSLTVRRKLLSGQQEVCSVRLVNRMPRMLTRTMTRAVTELEGFSVPELRRLYDGVQRRVVATVDVRQLMEEMKKEEIFRPHEHEDIVTEKSPQSRAKLLLDTLTRKGPRGLAAFCTVLEGKHQPILDAIKQALVSSMSTESMP